MKHTFTSHGITVEFDDNSKEVLAALQNAVERGLAAIGEDAVGYAQENIRRQDAVDTGRLLNSIKYEVRDDEVYIGSDVEHSIYVEFGTGKYYKGGGTPKESWVYFSEVDGKFHIAHPMRARPFLKPAAADHTKEFREKLKESLENA